MKLCLDSSLLIKLLTPEENSQQVQDMMASWLDDKHQLLSPKYACYEVYSTLRKKAFTGKLNKEQLAASLKYFHALTIKFVDDLFLLPKALQLAEKVGHTVIYDTLFLATAQDTDSTLWTCDRKFYDLAKPYFDNIECV